MTRRGCETLDTFLIRANGAADHEAKMEEKKSGRKWARMNRLEGEGQERTRERK